MSRLPLRSLAVGAMLLAMGAAAFAEPLATDDTTDPAASADPVASSDEPALEPLPDEVQAALREAIGGETPAVATANPQVSPKSMTRDWNRTDKPDGTAAVGVKRPLPTAWDSTIGADLNATPTPSPLPENTSQGSGAAWASVKVPGVASVDTRLEPGNDQGKLGTTVSRSVAVGGGNSLTLQNRVAVTETLGAPQPVPGTAAESGRIWSNDQTVKFNIGATGTTLAANTSRSNADAATHNSLSAQQKLFDDFNLTTTLSDVGTPTASRSITAGFKTRW